MNILTKLIPITHLDSVPHGYANGYIGVPKDHPWFGKDYDFVDCSVHGGLTYGADHCPNETPDGNWWLGFDTCHWQDNAETCPQAYCEAELESLKQQALNAI